MAQLGQTAMVLLENNWLGFKIPVKTMVGSVILKTGVVKDVVFLV